MNTIDDQEFGTDLRITETAKSYLLEACKWGKFLAIIGFIFIGLTIIGSVIGLGNASQFNAISSGFFVGSALIRILLVVLYFFPTFYLYKFSEKTKLGLTQGSQNETDEGLGFLKSLFKFIGIYTIVMLGLLLIMILVLSVLIN